MWLVFNIGCLHCSVTSAIVGVFAAKHQADFIAEVLNKKMSWRQDGHNIYTVFPLPVSESIADEYKPAFLPDIGA